MSIERDEAIVLGRTRFSETSLIVTLFTRARGPMRVIAKGARRSRSRFSGSLEPTNHVLAVYYRKEGRGLQTLSQCDIIRAYGGMRESLLRLAYGYAIIESLVGLKREETPAGPLFDIALGALSSADRNPGESLEAMFWSFLLAALAESGYRPELEQCLHCRKRPAPGPVRFDPRAGGIVCGDHGGGGIVLSPGTRGLLAALSSGEEPRGPIAPRETAEGREALRRFLQEHGIGKTPFRSLELLAGGLEERDS